MDNEQYRPAYTVEKGGDRALEYHHSINERVCGLSLSDFQRTTLRDTVYTGILASAW